jgi:hypothetical protein
MGDLDKDQLQPVGRFAWEKVIRRARLDGIVQGARKGTWVKGATLKAVALTMATYGNAAGAEVKPSVARIAIDCGISYQLAKRCVAGLREQLGLIELIRRGNDLDGSSIYRLVLPVDQTERLGTDPILYEQSVAALSKETRGVRVEKSPAQEAGAGGEVTCTAA